MKLLMTVAALAGLVCALPAVARANTFTVNTNDDLDGTCTALHCSLRQAINSANASPGKDVIAFDIPPGGPQTIQPLGRPLPTATDPATLDATTQPGYSGTPIIQIDGTFAGVAFGLDVSAGSSEILGFVINRFVNPAGGAFAGGIQLEGRPGDAVTNCYIGTDFSGTVALNNGLGIFVTNSDDTIGGTSLRDRNVISGNGDGMFIYLTAARNTVAGNYIGTDPTGTIAVPNANGLNINNGAADTVVGGPLPSYRNVISGNLDFGVIVNTTPGTVIRANYLGVDVTGNRALPNSGGVFVFNAPGTLITGTTGQNGNVVSGNTSDGVLIQSDGVIVGGNLIGLGADGATPIGNHASGVLVNGSDNTIGSTPYPASGPGSPNFIAYNGFRGGVFVVAGVRNPILDNHIWANIGLGIDLDPLFVPNPNDPGDLDTGANDGQNYPVITARFQNGSGTTVDGTLDSHPNTTYLIQLFRNDACDPRGFGQGQEPVLQFFVKTDATGTATFETGVSGGHAGDRITSTATDPAGNTSEFSNCAVASAQNVGSITTLSPPNAVNPVGTTHTVTAMVTSPTGGALAGVTVYFTVMGSVETTGHCTTDQNGQCSFTYRGPDLPGADEISAYADANANGMQDVTEISGTATKGWTAPASTPGQVTGGGQAPAIDGEIAFGFNAQNLNNGVKGNCNAVDATSHIHFKCLTVDSLVITGTHATFFGEGMLDGVATNYRIDVDDLAEPGVGSDTFRIQTGTGYLAGGVLTAGNIQIHR